MNLATDRIDDNDRHRPFRAWALQHDVLSLLGSGSEWPASATQLGLESDADEAPERAIRGQGFLREALATPPRTELRIRTSLMLWAAVLITETVNQLSPIGLPMPDAAFALTAGGIAVVMLMLFLVLPRMRADRLLVVEQCVLTAASLLILYQCSLTGGANSPYLVWFLLASYYAAYMLKRGQAVANLLWFTLVAAATLLLPQTHADSLVVLQLVTLLATNWAIATALLRQRAREDTLERTITFQALADPLTSTANMRAFDQYLSELARHDGQRFAVIVVDMNGLKGANAVFGHEIGDGMVVRMARLMLRASGDRDQVARFGGDEFAVVLPSARAADVARWRKEFEREVERHNTQVRGRLPQISVAMGAALYPEDGLIPADLIDVADRRMYEEKASVVQPPHDIHGAIAPDAGRAFRHARFQDAPREAIDVRDRMRQASVNWVVFGIPLLALAYVGGAAVHAAAAVACGFYALLLAAITEAFRTVPLTRIRTNVLDVLTLALPLPATWAAGGAGSPLLITLALPVAFYAQNFRSRRALPRVALVLIGYSIGFWAFGELGPTQEARYLTTLAAMLVIAAVMQHSSREQRRALAAIRRSATRDQLTALPNIFALRHDLDRALAAHEADPHSPAPALVVVDLDDFRRANTAGGHRGGDEILREVAKRLTDAAADAAVYRVDGDEFGLIVHGLDERGLESFARRCSGAVEHEHDFAPGNVTVLASAGHACGAPGLDGDSLVDLAEASLTRAKADREPPEAPNPGRIML
jgi:diguanylate cyclase (GGDEF)-like protein